jgi:tetratricopeptide (TPR) repeat protein
VGLVYTGYYTFSGDDLTSAHPSRVVDLYGAHDLARAYFLNDPPIMPSSVLMRRELFEQAGRFDASIKVFEDTEFYLRLARICRFAAVPEPLIYKRTRPGSITAQRSQLMAHHAFVAFKAAAANPSLTPLTPRRLAQRALKLGNVHYYAGQLDQAARLYGLAARLDPTNPRAWAAWSLTRIGGRAAHRVLRRRLAARASALGA